MENRKRYSTDLTDIEWNQIKGLIPEPSSPRGRRREYSRREILNAIFYVLRTGCQWRALPGDFVVAYTTVFCYFSDWTKQGVWEAIVERLRSRVRRAHGKQPAPRMAVVDSQSVPTDDQRGPRGYDGGKKVKGRKRHLLIDSLGLPLEVAVTPANEHDQHGAKQLLGKAILWHGRLEVIFGDKSYGGSLCDWVRQRRPWGKLRMSVVSKAENQKGFQVQPKRWLVERSFGWLGKFRRLDTDHEQRLDHSRAMIQLALSAVMLRRLAKLRPT